MNLKNKPITGHVYADILLKQIAFILKNMDRHPKYGAMQEYSKFILVAKEMFPQLNQDAVRKDPGIPSPSGLQNAQKAFLQILETYDQDHLL